MLIISPKGLRYKQEITPLKHMIYIKHLIPNNYKIFGLREPSSQINLYVN